MSERITENFVREVIKDFGNGALYWEQQPAHPKIKNLLKNASKSGKKQPGKPEFTIKFNDHPELVMVIECKADRKYHKKGNDKKTENAAGKYCVEGVLHYAKFLAKEYNVIAIAVSGTDRDLLAVDSFIHYRGADNHIPFLSNNSLLPLSDYLESFYKLDTTYNQDLTELISFTKELNSELHTKKIKSADRSLLIAAILTALRDGAFKHAYKRQSNPSLLIQQMKSIMEASFKKHVTRNPVSHLIANYSFMDASGELLKGDALQLLIDKVDTKLNKFEKTHEYYDLLGQFYVEFLRYSNDDKGLGIVLTPFHITELAARMINVNKYDVVLDNCAGTGGFLISSMKVMMEDAQGDKNHEERIKKKGLVGIEIDSTIVTLLCCNMFIHQDGRSNVYHGNCLENWEIINSVKNLKPTKGLLNPPFKADPKDIEEYEYVLNNLDALGAESKCAVILPMQCVIAQDGKRLELKEALLKRHTLEAVLSLPNDLFHQTAGTITCMIILTAHKPHASDKKVWLALGKDDGFLVKKHIGRVDENRIWEERQKEWLSWFENREEIEGFSVKRKLSAKDEWCAEAYVKKQFDSLRKEDFDRTLKKYIGYLFQADYIQDISSKPCKEEEIDIRLETWKWFRVSELFNISLGEYTAKADLLQGTYPYITRTAQNNGVDCYGSHGAVYDGNCITIGAEGVVAFYQPVPFLKGNKINLITSKHMNVYVAMFLCTVFNYVNLGIFNYGYAVVKKRLERVKIKLPVTSQGSEPDWEWMSDFVQTLRFSSNLLIN